MMDEKKLKETENRIKQYLADGTILTKQPIESADFFLNNAKNSLETAQAIYDLSTKGDYQEYTGHLGLNGFLWVVNAGYYSMFYAARALLAKEGIKFASDLSIHALTFDSIVHFFYLNGKLKDMLLEAFAEAQEDATEILGKEKADALVENYFYEKKKRAALTYETGETAMQRKAMTSLERARTFNQEIRKIMRTG